MGIATLSLATGAVVLIAVPVPRRRWILSRTWDRFQIPKPFTRVDVFFGAPLRPGARQLLPVRRGIHGDHEGGADEPGKAR